MSEPLRVIILGSTGSIGTQTISVIEHLNALHGRGTHPRRYRVVGLAAGRDARALEGQCRVLGVSHAALADGGSIEGVDLRIGPDGAERLVREVECDLVVSAIVGVAGLGSTLAAVELGRPVALANKETLVAAGAVVVPAARRAGSALLPIDSEHAGVWQCLGCGAPSPLDAPARVARVVLTASGGPFRDWPRERIERATVEEALRHPTWTMGRKVTIDSATLINKALELVEAHWLFGLEADQLGALIHPQSMVHAIVEFRDGSSLAQVGPTDMRIAIQAALTYPTLGADRVASSVAPITWASVGRLDFIEPDLDRFPGLALGEIAIQRGGAAGAALNAANEEAVRAFLAEQLPFGAIARCAREAMEACGGGPARTLDEVLETDRRAREHARAWIARTSAKLMT